MPSRPTFFDEFAENTVRNTMRELSEYAARSTLSMEDSLADLKEMLKRLNIGIDFVETESLTEITYEAEFEDLMKGDK